MVITEYRIPSKNSICFCESPFVKRGKTEFSPISTLVPPANDSLSGVSSPPARVTPAHVDSDLDLVGVRVDDLPGDLRLAFDHENAPEG